MGEKPYLLGGTPLWAYSTEGAQDIWVDELGTVSHVPRPVRQSIQRQLVGFRATRRTLSLQIPRGAGNAKSTQTATSQVTRPGGNRCVLAASAAAAQGAEVLDLVGLNNTFTADPVNSGAGGVPTRDAWEARDGQ